MARLDPFSSLAPDRRGGSDRSHRLGPCGSATPATASGGEIRQERSAKAIRGQYVVVLDDAGLDKRQPDTVTNFLARGHRRS